MRFAERRIVGTEPGGGAAARPSRWDPLTLALGGVLLQYVWRVQEVLPVLRYVQFTAVVSAAAILLFVVQGHPRRRLTTLRHPLFRPVIAITVLAVLSVPTSLRVGGSFDFLTGNFLKTVALAGLLASSVRDRADVERLLRVFVIGGAGYVLAAVAFAGSGSGRLGGKGSYDPNDLGLFTVCTIPMCIYLMRRAAPMRDRISGAVSTVVLLAGTVQSGSRGGFLALIALSLYALLGLGAVRRSKRITVAVVTFSVIAGVASDSYWDRMRTILRPEEDYNWAGMAESGRIELWKRGLGYMAERPLSGVGVNQFDVAEGTLSPQALARQESGLGFRWSAAHSSYVQVGAELGVFGLLAYVALLIMSYREARRVARAAAVPADRLLAQAFGGTVTAYVVGGAFLSQAYSTYLYFAIGLLIGFSRVVTRARAAAAAGVSAPSAPPRGAGGGAGVPAGSTRRRGGAW